MRFEKINDNQIRCTLSSADLQDRHIRLSELVYGGEKARGLFDEMLEKALIEHNFDTEDFPVMIEAVPMTGDSLMLLITKMEDPEELDTRFAKFTPAAEEAEAFPMPELPVTIGADDILKIFSNLANFQKEESENSEAKTEPKQPERFIRVFCFSQLDDISESCRAVEFLFSGTSALYKDPASSRYYLVISLADSNPEDFNRTCNILSEFGKDIFALPAEDAYYQEHFETIIADHAVETMALI